MFIVLLFLLLLIFIVSAACWGTDSRDSLEHAEWKRRLEYDLAHRHHL